MTIGKALRDLGSVVEDLESGDAEVATVRMEDSDPDGADGISATVELAIRLLDDTDGGIDVSPENVRIDDGRLTLDLAVSVHDDFPGRDATSAEDYHRGRDRDAPEDVADADVEPSDTGVAADDSRPPEESGADGAPPHRDPARLREVYDESRTFAEMTEALGADVTAQTVRRNMIKHGIHEPAQKGADEGDGPPTTAGEGTEEADEDAKTALADGIDLPPGTSLGEIKDAVRSGRTLYEVQTKLGVDRARARRILRELGLLDLVAGRLQAGDREVTEAEIDERIQGAAPTGT